MWFPQLFYQRCPEEWFFWESVFKIVGTLDRNDEARQKKWDATINGVKRLKLFCYKLFVYGCIYMNK